MVLRATAATLAGAVTLLVLGACSQTEETGGTPRSETPVTLQLPAAGAGRCMAPSVDRLAQADVAFDGTVDKISGTDVEMRVDSWFTQGGGDESVIITTLRGTRTTEAIPIFRQGDRYLVAAAGTQVIVCGVSDVWSPELEVLYQRAFG